MIGTLAMTVFSLLLNGQDPASLPPGALEGWTSTDAVVVQARELVAAGRWSEAETVLKQNDRPDSAAAARRDMAEIIRRMRYDYDVDEVGLLAKIHRQLPEVTSDDLKRWREAGEVRFRTVDGQIRYFRSEPGNLYRFCPEARRRLQEKAHERTPAAANARDASQLVRHLAEVIAAAGKREGLGGKTTEGPRYGGVEGQGDGGATQVLPVRHRVSYKLTVAGNRPGAKKGSLVRCWLPFPQEYRQQKDVKLIRTVPARHLIAPSAVREDSGALPERSDPNSKIQDPESEISDLKSDFPGAPQRTVYLERTIDDPSIPAVFEVVFEYTSCAYYPRLDPEKVRSLPAGFDRRYLAERPPHIVFTPEIKALADQLVGDETNPLLKARRIFHYLDRTVFWGPEEEYSIIPSFSMQALTRKQGDCGLQSTLFIALCRCAGVPARWQSGFQTKPWGWNMHDWSEIYIEPWGWLPVDMSYGLQPSDDPQIREFYLGHQDSYRLIVNLDYGRELVPPKHSPRSEPADFQRGEVEIDGRNLYYDEWDYDIRFEWEGLKSE